MNGWKLVISGVTVGLALEAGGCVGPEPTAGTGECASVAGTWSIEGTCAASTGCKFTQIGCTASFTCDDGTHSNSVSLNGSGFSVPATTADGTTLTCNGTVTDRTLSGTCTAAGQTQQCTLTGTNTSPAGTGGASGSGGETGSGGRTGGSGGTPPSTGGGGGMPPGACPLTAKNPQCGTCFTTNCQSICNSCGAVPECGAALNCVTGCGTDTAACTACTSSLSSTSLASFQNVLDCLATTCATACGGSTSGKIGDPCTIDADCTAGTCSSRWCSTSCTTDANCGTNSAGQTNHCVTNAASAQTCFPGCSTAADCAAFAGTTCQPVVGGTGTICALPPTGGGGTTSHGFTYSSATCATCATTSCTAEETSCAADPSCVQFFKCASPCGSDDTCLQNCLNPLSSTSLTTASDMLTCLVNGCPTCGPPQ